MYLAFHDLVSESWVKPWLVSCYVFELAMIVLTLVSHYTYTMAYLPFLKKALERK
jgi:hypothetical protein